MLGTKKLRFWFHYNKPASLSARKPQITVHFQKTCHIVDNIEIKVPTWGRIRKDQPKFVIVGDAEVIRIDDGIAYIS